MGERRASVEPGRAGSAVSTFEHGRSPGAGRFRGLLLTAAAASLALFAYRAIRARREAAHRVGSTVGACSQVTIQRPAGEVFRFLRDPSNLGRFSRLHVKPAHEPRADLWRVRAGRAIWEFRETSAEEGVLLAWSTVPSSPLAGAAVVHLIDGPFECELHADIWFVPPAAPITAPVLRRIEGSRVLRRAGLTPSQLLQQELRRLRQLLEAGEIATIKGQSSGREARRGRLRHQGMAASRQ